MMMTSQAHFGRLLIAVSGVREQSMMLKIIKARMMIAAMTATRTMTRF
jgi:hypothetical protein